MKFTVIEVAALLRIHHSNILTYLAEGRFTGFDPVLASHSALTYLRHSPTPMVDQLFC
jgi:hypothetical protein